MNNICGFIVLRKPEHNHNDGLVGYGSRLLRIGTLYYPGIERMGWFDIDEDFYLGKLPEDITSIRQEISDSITGLCVDLTKTRKLLDYSNRTADINEIGVVYFKRLADMAGCFACPVPVQWLGVDIVTSGYGSMLAQGIYRYPALFHSFIDKLNPNGLFDPESEYIDEYIKHYTEIEKANNLEPMSKVLHLVDRIAIGRIA